MALYTTTKPTFKGGYLRGTYKALNKYVLLLA